MAVVYLLTRNVARDVPIELGSTGRPTLEGTMAPAHLKDAQTVLDERGRSSFVGLEAWTASRVLGVYARKADADADKALSPSREELDVESWEVFEAPRGIAPVCSKCGIYHPGPCAS